MDSLLKNILINTKLFTSTTAILTCFLIATLTGCSLSTHAPHSNIANQSSKDLNDQLMTNRMAKQSFDIAPMLSSGSLTIAKKMPSETALSDLPIYGFIPFQVQTGGVASNKPIWLEIDLDDASASLKKGKTDIISSDIKNESSLPVKGIYAVNYMAKSPLWHASEEYFTLRNLPIPAEGDASRLLKGALGEHALFLDSGLILHSGSNTLEEEYQLQLDERVLADIYSQVADGTKVIIK